MKCTQCGCNDLEKVDFPYHANLIMTRCGIAGSASFYDLEEEFDEYLRNCLEVREFANAWIAEHQAENDSDDVHEL